MCRFIHVVLFFLYQTTGEEELSDDELPPDVDLSDPFFAEELGTTGDDQSCQSLSGLVSHSSVFVFFDRATSLSWFMDGQTRVL